MPRFLLQAAYTPQAWAALTRNPENRAQGLGRLVENLGGRLVSLDYCFGEYDVVVIIDAPDETTAAAVSLAVTSPGHLKAVKTTPLLSVEQAMEAMRKAGSQTYRAPGQ
jgi:uncharacterized protein with GYD domain